MATPSPTQTAETLRRIATGLDQTEKPDPVKVAKAIKGVIASLNPKAPPEAPKTINPQQAAEGLRQIATAIEGSKNPDPVLVAKDIKKLLASITPAS